MTPLALILTLIGAIATDGDTLRKGDARYRIWGIDAAEMDAGGGPAKRAMAGLIKGQTLTCDVLDVDRYHRQVVRCDLPDGRDLACVMVGAGMALDWPKYSRGYYRGCR